MRDDEEALSVAFLWWRSEIQFIHFTHTLAGSLSLSTSKANYFERGELFTGCQRQDSWKTLGVSQETWVKKKVAHCAVKRRWCGMETMLSDIEANLSTTYARKPGRVFTKENAAEYGRKGAAARLATLKARKDRVQAIVKLATPTAEDERKLRVSRQIELIDLQIAEHADDPEMLVKLTQAKARLWELVFAKPASQRQPTKPRQSAQVEPIQAPDAPQ